MKVYAGIDLHSNNSYIVLLTEEDKVIFQKRLPNDLDSILGVLKPHQNNIQGVVIESTYNWFWLADGLIENGFNVHLANPTAIQQYSGLKHTDDKTDARWLAKMLSLEILPEGYIFPKELRSVREQLRKRLWLVHKQTMFVLSLQSMITRYRGIRLGGEKIKKLNTEDLKRYFPEEPLYLAAYSQWAILGVMLNEILRLEQSLLKQLKIDKRFNRIKSIPGIGEILGMTILLESGPMDRFNDVGNYASYCRCVNSKRISNGKKKAENNRKNGNKYLAWAFIEAANFAIYRHSDITRYYQKKLGKTCRVVALKTVANKLARACFYVLKNAEDFKMKKVFIS